MTEVRKVYADDFATILPLLEGFHNQKLNQEDWRWLFVHPWDSPEEHFGYRMLDGDKTVGFIGTVFSTQIIHGKAEKFCNLSSWYVMPEYRHESLAVLFPVLGLKDFTLTNFTANQHIASLMRGFGFKDLEPSFKIILPFPAGLLSSGTVITNKQDIPNHLDETNLKIFQDHAALHCDHAFYMNKAESCYLVMNMTRKKGLPIAYIDYISDIDIFLKHANEIAWRIGRQMKVAGLMVGDRFTRTRSIPGSLTVVRKQFLLYRSNHLAESDIDTLYSEIQLLGHEPR
jgi:hypothetical protein